MVTITWMEERSSDPPASTVAAVNWILQEDVTGITEEAGGAMAAEGQAEGPAEISWEGPFTLDGDRGGSTDRGSGRAGSFPSCPGLRPLGEDWPDWSYIPSEGQGPQWFQGTGHMVVLRDAPATQSWGLSPSSTLQTRHAWDVGSSPRAQCPEPLSRVQPQRSVSQGVALELLLLLPSSHMAGLKPPPLCPPPPPPMWIQGEYSPGPVLLESRRLRVPLLTLHPGTLSPRWLVAREWGRRLFSVTSDAEFFPIWKVIRSMQSLCTWPCAGGSAGSPVHWCCPGSLVHI